MIKPTNSETEILIQAGQREMHYWRDLWRYRELLYFLAWRDILVRYKQTIAGSAWALLRPLLNTIVFTVLFSRLGKFPSDGVPYPVLVLAGMVPWQLFSGSVLGATQSLVSNSNLISKVYFPRLIIPCSTLGVAFVDFLFTFGLMILVAAWYGVMPTMRLAALPLLALYALLASLGPSVLIAAMMVKFRDFKHVVPFLVQIGTFVCPVGYSSSAIPEQWRLLYSCNPMVGVIDGFRWAVHGGASLHLPGFLISIGITLLLTVVGLWYFRRTEKTFADVI